MAQVQDQVLDQSIRDCFAAALAEGQEFLEVFAPEPEMYVQECAFDVLVRMGANRSCLAVRDFDKWEQGEAQGLLEWSWGSVGLVDSFWLQWKGVQMPRRRTPYQAQLARACIFGRDEEQ